MPHLPLPGPGAPPIIRAAASRPFSGPIMLQAIRSKATSFVVKILFALLILTFGVWGIGDIFRNRSTDTTVATVGGRTITIEQLATAVRSDLQRLQSVLGGTIDPAQAKQLGVVDNALQRIVGSDLVDLEIDRLHLAVGDEAVRQAILANPAFRNQQGIFDRNLYQAVLANNRMSEPQFEAQLRDGHSARRARPAPSPKAGRRPRS